ncbi:MAG: hypothetical protein ACE5E7_10105 [Anaerolineae bacterium]
MSLQARIIKLLLPIQFRGWGQLSITGMRARQQNGSRLVRLSAGIVTEPMNRRQCIWPPLAWWPFSVTIQD